MDYEHRATMGEKTVLIEIIVYVVGIGVTIIMGAMLHDLVFDKKDETISTSALESHYLWRLKMQSEFGEAMDADFAKETDQIQEELHKRYTK